MVPVNLLGYKTGKLTLFFLYLFSYFHMLKYISSYFGCNFIKYRTRFDSFLVVIADPDMIKEAIDVCKSKPEFPYQVSDSSHLEVLGPFFLGGPIILGSHYWRACKI